MTTRRSLLRSGAILATAAATRAFAGPALLKSAPREVASVLGGVPSVDGAGVHLTRVIGHSGLRNLDPFVLLDQLRSNDPAAYRGGFPDHPHRGFETVTVMLEGHMRHRDSRGNAGDIIGGGAQWMTAGRGIVHSEMPDDQRRGLSGFQLWVNLPAKEKLCPQYYQDLQPAQLAEGKLSRAGSVLRLISGSVEGLHGPVRDRPTAPVLGTLTLEDDQPFVLELPEGHTAFVYVVDGELEVGSGRMVPPASLAVLGAGRSVRLRATRERSVVLFGAGKPINEPIVQSGPFVMNTQAEIAQAWADYRAGTLDKT